METPQENSSLNPPESAATSKNPKRVEAGRRATATRKAAREEDAKILEQLQASKMELQQPPDNTDSKMDLTPWIVGGVGILVVAWYGYSQHSAGKPVMVAPRQAPLEPPSSYAPPQRAADLFYMA